MNATELRRMKRLLSSSLLEEQLSGLCVASYAASSFQTGQEPQLYHLASAVSGVVSVDYLLHALQAGFKEHTKLIHTAAVDCICMLAVTQDGRQLFTQVELEPEIWMKLLTLSNSTLLQEGAMKFLDHYARSMAVVQQQNLTQMIEHIIDSDTVAEQFTPVQTLHAVTAIVKLLQAIQQDKATMGQEAVQNVVCQNETVTAKLRKLCTQTMYGAAQDFVRDEAIRCVDTLLQILGPAWTVESNGSKGEFASLLVAVVRGELHLLLEELLYWASGSTYEEHSTTVEAEKGSRTSRLVLVIPSLRLFELFVSYLCGEDLVEYSTTQPSWQDLPTDRLLHIQHSLHQNVSSLCEFIGNARRVTPIKPLAPVLSRAILLAAKAICVYALEDEADEIQEKAMKMIEDLSNIISENEKIDDVESMLALVEALLATEEDAILVRIMYPEEG